VNDFYTIGAYALLGVGILAYAASIFCYLSAVRKEQTSPALAGRTISVVAGALVLLSIGLLAKLRQGVPFSSMAEFLILLACIQTIGTLILDFTKRLGILTMGNAVACVLIVGTAVLILPPDLTQKRESVASSPHILTFLASLVAFEVSFLSVFTYLLLKKFLKDKGHLWLFELAPSLEVTRRTAMISLLLGFLGLTAGILAGYLFARQAKEGPGWRMDVTILLSTATWLSYLLTVIFGAVSKFYSRRYASMNMISFVLLMTTLLSTVFFSGLHKL
jgi:hypothetical protein